MLGHGNVEYGPPRLPPGIRQPCACHLDGRCSVYASRPAVCASYDCTLLTRYAQGEVSAEDALQRIRQVRDLADWIRDYIQARMPVQHRSVWSAVFRFMKSEEAADLGSFRAAHAEFFLKIGILDMLSVRHFGTKRRCGDQTSGGSTPLAEYAPTGME
jgi:hypothetical protein